MKRIFCGVTLAFVMAGAIAAGNSIPAEFQGKWATARDCKAAKKGDPEAAMGVLEVSSKAINGAEWSCEVKKVTDSNQFHFSGVFSCMGDGVGADREKVSLDLDAGKLRFTDNSGQVFNNTEALPRCK